MTCRELNEFLLDYHAGELPEAQRALFEQHLRGCAPCMAYLASYEDTIKLGRAAFRDDDAPVPPEVPTELVRAILKARRKS